MLQKDKEPVQSMLSKVCEHTFDDTQVDGRPNPDRVEIMVSPVKVKGHDIALVGDDYPLVAFVEMGCFDPALNNKLPPGFTPQRLWGFFVADEYIGGKAEKGHVQIRCENMLPWYEWAIGRYLLPPVWTIKDWVFTNGAGEQVPYVKGLTLYPDGSWHGVDNAEAVMRNFDLAHRRVNGYVTEVIRGTNQRSDISITDYDSAMIAMRNQTIPDDLEKTAMDHVYGYGGRAERGAKETRQALTAFLQSKLGVPIRVFEPVYSWPNS